MAVTSAAGDAVGSGYCPAMFISSMTTPALRTALKRLLSSAGYDVETYSSAQDLLERLPDETRPGCIYSDVRMPGLSGPDLQTLLNQRGSTLPIIFLTGHADIQDDGTDGQGGRARLLMKPVPADSCCPRSIGHWSGTKRHGLQKPPSTTFSAHRCEVHAARAAGF